MSSKRKLKKEINATMDTLYVDCIFYKVFVVGANLEAADNAIRHIVEVQNELLRRFGANEGKEVKGRVKSYYKKLKADFKEQVDTIAKEIGTLA